MKRVDCAIIIMVGTVCFFVGNSQGQIIHSVKKEAGLPDFTQIDCQLEPLGYANRAVGYGNNFAVVAPGTDGQGKFFYISYYRNSGKAEILGFDRQNKQYRRYVSNSAGLYGMIQASDGIIYAGGINKGWLYMLRPGSEKLESIGDSVLVQYIWDLTEAPDGKIYGAGYPQAKLIEYDPATKVLKDLGRMSTERNYIRFISAAPDGRLWCSVGHPALLFVYDPRTGERE